MYLDSYIPSNKRELVELIQETSNQINKVELQNKTNYDKKNINNQHIAFKGT